MATFATFVTLQFSIYERIIQWQKQNQSAEDYTKNEFKINLQAGLCAGVIAAASTNALEAITVAKQTNPDKNLMKMIQKEGRSLLTKGLLARVTYNSM